MDFHLETLGATKRKMSVEVPAETVQSELNQALNQVRKTSKLKGFRPGKAPKEIIKRMFGPQIEQEVAQNLLNESLPKALNEAGLSLASSPVLEDSRLSEGEPFHFTVSFEIKPQFQISGYEGLPLTKKTLNITEEMVDKKMEDLRQAYATTRSLAEDRPARTADLAVLDYKSYIGQEPIEGGSNPNYQIEIGSGRFNKDFESQLEGMTKDEEKSITVSFPDDHYNPKLAGQTVRFEVKLVDIKEKVLPELNDDFAKDLGEKIETLAKLRELVRQDMISSEEARIENQVRDQLKDKLLELVDFESPESMVNAEIESMISTTRFNLERSGLNLEAMGFAEAKMKEDYRPDAVKRVKTALILLQIAEDKGFEVSAEELNDRLLQMAREIGQPPEIVKEFYSKNDRLSTLNEAMLREKTLNYLLENANIEFTDRVTADHEDQTESTASDEAGS